MDGQIEVLTLRSVAAGRARGGRPTQQDDLVCLDDPRRDARLLVVADGMGGDGAGELASEGVVAVARRLWAEGLWREQPGAQFLETLCQEAHLELRRRGRGLAAGQPHSTIVALLMQGARVCWAHVGDSRLYRFRGRRCLDRTEDHSVAQLRVGRGELSSDQLATAPDQHKLLRGLGGPRPLQVDHGFATVRPGQAFALCSDGVWEQLSTRELAALARRHDQRGALVAGLNRALERGGETGDNVALILVRVGWKAWLTRRSSGLRSWILGRTACDDGDVAGAGHDRADRREAGVERVRSRSRRTERPRLARWAGVLLAAFGMAGCGSLHTGATHAAGPRVTPDVNPPVTAPAGGTSASPLGAIINDELQHGHYAEGERALRRYLAQHPGDRPAQSMLRQLTADPTQMLGQASRRYVVQPGDSFSALAARYLGDPNLFLILARYNGSTHPSQLAVGESIRLPAAAPGMSAPGNVVTRGPGDANARPAADESPSISPTPAPPVEAAAAKAVRFQAESVALLERGHRSQALARLDEALDIDPRLQPSGPKAASLHRELVGDYHQRAVILYRDQHLDQAIALWNHVLAIEPGYEPALIYRARALELKQRLKQFDTR